MQLKVKESSVDAKRDGVLGDPLSIVIPALSSNFSHFGHFTKIHLNPLSSVVSPGNIRTMVVESTFARLIPSAILKEQVMSLISVLCLQLKREAAA